MKKQPVHIEQPGSTGTSDHSYPSRFHAANRAQGVWWGNKVVLLIDSRFGTPASRLTSSRGPFHGLFFSENEHIG